MRLWSPKGSCRADSSRERSVAGHPLADHLRLTVRNPDENDRLIAAANDMRETTA